MSNSLVMITKQQIGANYSEEISIKSDAKKKKNILRYQKKYGKLSANSLAIIIKQEIRISYIEKISVKSDAKKIKYYDISKSYWKLSANSLAMITKQ